MSNDANEEKPQKIGSKSITSHRPSNDPDSTSQRQSAAEKNGDSSFVPTATGPRTPQGKVRSKSNAIKHGIFSKVAVLRNESRPKYRSLLAGLVEYHQPYGMMEDILVEKLAVIAWQTRRSLAAVTAGIQTGIESFEWEEKIKQEKIAEEIEVNPFWLSSLDEGLIRHRENPVILARCLELLNELRQRLTNKGISYERADQILAKLYGEVDEEGSLLDSYRAWRDTSVSEEKRKVEGYASPSQSKERFLEKINIEICRLTDYQKTRASMESKRRELEILRRGIPEADRLDRLQRYQTSLDRAFDRTLNQLERLQRIRRGQPLPPQIDVKVSSDDG